MVSNNFRAKIDGTQYYGLDLICFVIELRIHYVQMNK